MVPRAAHPRRGRGADHVATRTIGLSRLATPSLDSTAVSLPSHEAARPGIDWRWALPRIAAVFLVSRLLVLVVAVAAETFHPAPPNAVRVDERPILGSLMLWDAEHYLAIAQDGYQAEFATFPEYAFYPGFPTAMRAAALATGGDLGLAGVLVANIAFALALAVLYALSLRYQAPQRAILSLWFLALAPPDFVFTMAYSDSLFLLLAVGAFLAAEARRHWLAGGLVALAAVTRAPGILLCLPLFVLVVQRDGVRSVRSWLPLLLAPLALAAFFGYLWWLTGDPLAAVHAQEAWEPAEPASAAGVASASRIIPVAPGWIVAYWIGALLFYGFLFVYFRHDRIRPAYWLVALLAVASVFLSGTLESAPRYIAVGWPFAWVLANRDSRIGRGAVLVGFAAGQAVIAWLAFTLVLAP
jgi:Gpi18-like mannosyltransferase